MELSPFIVTFKLAFITTSLLLLVSLPLGWWLSRSQSLFSTLIGTVFSLPLVLPPTVLGFYLLISFGPEGVIGKVTDSMGIGSLAFTFSGLVIGSMIYSLPFVLGPIQSAFETIDDRLIHTSYSLGASPFVTFIKVIIPTIRHAIITGCILGFSHTVGEFGVVLMIGGNIPDKTKVLSVAIYDSVESLDYTNAHIMSVSLIVLSLAMLWPVYRSRRINRAIYG